MQIEATGKTVEIAIQNGLLECGMKREDVQVKVIDNGGLFKKAKVVLIYGESKEEQTQVEIEQPAEIEQIEVNEQPEIIENKKEEQPKKKIIDTARLQQRGKEFLTGLAKFVDDNATVDVEAKENEILFSIKGENLGKLIGYKGENLTAIQMLLSGLKVKGEGAVRLYLDIAGYKANKNQALIDLANKTADQAVKIERNIHLDPMNAYERRIIHTTIQERTDATTESTGEGEKRHVVVKPVFKK